jgi:hypothetical protein
LKEFTVKITGPNENLFGEKEVNDALVSYACHNGMGLDLEIQSETRRDDPKNG